MDIPKMKIFIYVLTFLGYCWSGYGAGILGNLRDAVLAAEHVFGDVLENVVTVVRKFGDIHEVFSAAVEEECMFKCPDGAKTVKDKYHKPSSDGCGSLGLTIPEDQLPVADMTRCCNEHDICYDTCGQKKEVCDIDFKSCLYRICDKLESVGETAVKMPPPYDKTRASIIACKATAKVLFTGTMTLGCKSYLDCQQKACYCIAPKRQRYAGGEL